MKITSVELFQVPPRWLFLKIDTDSGVSGWGEPIVEGRAATVKAAVEELSGYLIGRDPRQIEDIWQVLYRAGFYRGGPVLSSAASGIDQALWDIKGKDLGKPVYDLLGGPVRDRMKVYGWIGGDRPGHVAEQAKQKLAEGYGAIKMNATENMNWIDTYKTVTETLERVQAVRDAVGYNLELALDFHGRVHKAMARVLMKELEPFHLMFVEEPVLTENEEAFIELRRGSSIPIATGERNYTRWGFKGIITGGGVDIIQPDLSHAGGLTEVKKIASMAEAYDVALAPHCPLGPIALASCLNVDATCYNAVIQEQSIGIHYNVGKSVLDYVKNQDDFKFVDGRVQLPVRPGLGVDVNKELVLEENKTPHEWKNPVWRHKDGSVAEW